MRVMEPSSTEVVYTPAEIAQVLRVGEETIRREIQRGNLSAVRVGRQFRVTSSDVVGWLGKERYLKLFTPVEALLEILGRGDLEEEEATALAEKLVKRARAELWSERKAEDPAPLPEGKAPSAEEVRERLKQRRGKTP